jgi:hypothetical protein
MPTDIVIATDQPNLAFTGFCADDITSAYETTPAPTATVPVGGVRSHLLTGAIAGNKPSLLHVIPVATGTAALTSSNFIGGCVLITGWQQTQNTAGTTIYIPKVLAELQVAFPASGAGSLANFPASGTTAYWFNTVTVAAGVPTVNLYSPGTALSTSPQLAGALIDTVGCRWLTAQYKATTNSANGKCGILWASL